jgi:hypothetical protein
MSLHFEAECKYAVVTFYPYRNGVGKPGRVHVSNDAAYCGYGRRLLEKRTPSHPMDIGMRGLDQDS